MPRNVLITVIRCEPKYFVKSIISEDGIKQNPQNKARADFLDIFRPITRVISTEGN